MTILIWLIGFLFTLGFHRYDKREEEMKGFITFLIIFLWPITLGYDLRNILCHSSNS